METVALTERPHDGAASDVWLETFGQAALADPCAQTACMPAISRIDDAKIPLHINILAHDHVGAAAPKRRWWAWLASVLLHGAVAGVFLFIGVWLAGRRVGRRALIMIPQGMNKTFHRQPGGVFNPGIMHDRLRRALQDQRRLPHARGFAAVPTLRHLSELMRGGGLGRTRAVIGLGAAAAGRPAGLTGAQQALARFGLPGGGVRLAPKSQLLGIGGNARRIVYVLDNSGSMINGFPVLRRAVRRSIGRLRAFQRFNVIIFAHRYRLLGPPRLLRATHAMRDRMIHRLDRVPVVDGGGNDDRVEPFLRPLKAAFDLTPPAQLVYFVTDGHFRHGLVRAVRRMNRGRHVAVFTYAFF